MIWTLALRNLVFDRVRLVVALTGIAFAVLLAGAQLGLYVGASKLITNMIDHTGGDLWVMHTGTESFEEGLPMLGPRERSQAASTRWSFASVTARSSSTKPAASRSSTANSDSPGSGPSTRKSSK